MKRIDSHIHLFTEDHFPHLAWMTDDNPLRARHTIDEYLASDDVKDLGGCIFVETDRFFESLPAPGESDAAWIASLEWPLEEYTFGLALAVSHPELLGVVSWAPLPLGSAGLDHWHSIVPVSPLLKGVRYLVQDKPDGVISAPGFIDGLRWCRQKGLAFDLGVDTHSRGNAHLTEAVDAFEQVFAAGQDAGNPGALVLNHLGKPDMTISVDGLEKTPPFQGWLAQMRRLAAFAGNEVFVKLSGGFSEVDHERLAQVWLKHGDEGVVNSVVNSLLPWVDAVFAVFGAQQVMWASDWPVCGLGWKKVTGGREAAVRMWRRVSEVLVDEMVERGRMREDEREAVWAGNARRAYKI